MLNITLVNFLKGKDRIALGIEYIGRLGALKFKLSLPVKFVEP